jgi:hypothetical protein
MRSSKSRSRSKSNNRQRPLGNIVNRVFDSSGPEGKVRGTPQQIIDKYLMLARDAQLSNDRVAEQNFLQHAEHYTRMLGEAQREMNREQEARQNQHEARQNQGDGGQQNGNAQSANGNQNSNGAQNGGSGQGGGSERNTNPNKRNDDRNDRSRPDRLQAGVERRDDADDGPGLVETPEMRQRGLAEVSVSAPMMPSIPQDTEMSAPMSDAPAKKPRAPRGPRKPKTSAESTSAPSTDPTPDAAE